MIRVANYPGLYLLGDDICHNIKSLRRLRCAESFRFRDQLSLTIFTHNNVGQELGNCAAYLGCLSQGIKECPRNTLQCDSAVSGDYG